MSVINNVKDVLHRIRVKLYPSHLPGLKGAYTARTSNEAILDIRQICASLKDRGGFTGNYDDLVSHVHQFLDELVYLLCDGYAVNTGYFSIHPVVGGSFSTAHESYDPAKHSINFRFRTRPALRRMIKYITIEIEGLANILGSIEKFTDIEKKSVNTFYAPGDIFRVSGRKIKVTGSDPSCGVYFVSVDDPSRQVKVGQLIKNSSTELVGIVPETDFQRGTIEIHTQFTGSSNTFLDTPRITKGDFVIEKV